MHSPPPDEDLDLLLEAEAEQDAELEGEEEEATQEEQIPIDLEEVEINNNNQNNSNSNSSLPAASTTTPASNDKKLKQSTLIPTFQQSKSSEYLIPLNVNQKEAVIFKLEGGLQILAGPGSGKTKVLTTRVAYILQTYRVLPEEMVVVTFTNKAANEMKARLSLLVGPVITEKLVMGTFHSVCVKYLRKHGRLVDLPSNFIIADRNDCLAIIRRASSLQPKFSSHTKELKPNFISDIISKCKSTNLNPDTYLIERNLDSPSMSPEAREKLDILVEIFREYERSLKSDNALDFDDLLIYGLDLVKRFPRVVEKIKTVLIDEFQDTNSIQYELVKCIAKASKSLTIVGDPDQSVYGWRNAQIENLDKMIKDFPGTKQIHLEENYRSTGAIIGSAVAIISQDTKRINKKLKPTHGAGSSVVLHKARDAPSEASFIAAQIKHLIVYSGGLLDFNDVAILLRYGAMSRVIEVALQKAGIPSRMVGGNKFFERAEVKDILSYLQLIDNPTYSSAVARMINVPKRGIGDKTIQGILAAAKLNKISAFEVCVKSANGSGMAGVTSNQRKAIRDFVTVIRDLRAAAEEGASVPDLIDQIIRAVDYNAHLEKTQGSVDAKERYENILELKAYAVLVSEENPEGLDVAADVVPMDVSEDSKYVEGGGDSGYLEGEDMEDIVMSSQMDATTSNPLRTFLAVSMLATDTEESSSKEDAKSKKVTISTVHSAKGLEYAVTFIPGCEGGIYPFYRCATENEIDEERRLLYVAVTRAKVFCCLSHAENRMLGAESKPKKLSPFLKKVVPKYPTLFVPTLQKITPASRIEMAKVLGRAKVLDEATIAKNIAEHLSSLPPDPPAHQPYTSQNGMKRYGSSGSFNNSSSGTFGGSNSGQWGGTRPSIPAAVPSGSGFSSALKTHQATPLVPSQPIASTSKPPSAPSLPKDQPRLPFASPQRFVVPASSKIIKPAAILASTPVLAPSIPVPLLAPDLLPSKIKPFKAPAFRRPTNTPTPIEVPTPIIAPSLPISPPKATTSGKGSLKMPETRQSLIDEAVLLNPVYREPVDLLEKFKQAEVESLKSMTGGNSVSLDLTGPSSDSDVVAAVSASGRAIRGAAKRASEGFPKKSAPAKKKKKSS